MLTAVTCAHFEYDGGKHCGYDARIAKLGVTAVVRLHVVLAVSWVEMPYRSLVSLRLSKVWGKQSASSVRFLCGDGFRH